MDGARQVCIFDSEKNTHALRSFLSENGCRVARCTSGADGCARCAEHGRHPDVILLNAHDGASALQVIGTIRKYEGLRHVPLIVYDSVGDRSRMAELLDHGASDYLQAPLLKQELLAKIRAGARVQSLLRSFGRFVPGNYAQLMNKKDLAAIAPGEFVLVPLSVLFTDVRSFTQMSENLAAADIFRFLNSLFSRMQPVITSNRGFIDKYIGDAILALFPVSPEDCLKAGLAMMGELRLYNDHRAKSGYPPVQMGLGMHTGEVALGTVGSQERLNATVVGDAVNLASRVETLTKVFAVDLILTDAIRQGLAAPDRYRLREIDVVRVKGKQTPIVLYEAFDTNPPEMIEKKMKMMDNYLGGLAEYKRGNFPAAMDVFAACRETCPEDKIPDIYMRRCNSLIRVPPGKDWAGISTL